MKRRRLLIVLAAVALSVAATAASIAENVASAAEDWPQFRGHHRDGISPATGLLDTWPEGGPKELWRTSIGEGYSAISVADGKLYTMYAEAPPEEAVETEPAEGETEAEAEKPKTEYAVAYDAVSGEQLWRVPIGVRITTQFGNGPRSTPTVDGDVVYVLGAHGELAALSTADGSTKWQVTFSEAFGSPQPYWGYSTSSLVEGDLLLVESLGPDGKEYVAFDKKSGEVRWTSGEPSPGGSYNSPMAITMGGKRQFVYIGNKLLRSIDAEGKELWSHPWPEGESHTMPIFIEPDLFFASGTEGIGAAVVRVKNDGGEMKAEEVWQSRVMRNHFSSSVLHDGYIYGFDNATLKCISVEAGEQQWAKRGFGKGSLIYADGHIIVLSDRGVLIQAEATPEAYKEKGRIQALEGKSWTAPSLAGGKLYLRNEAEMVSYDLNG